MPLYQPSDYKGYTYPKLFDNRVAHWLWRHLFCRGGWHLWDECLSPFAHVLYCDACEVEFGDRA
jgi:hypothetical protein